MITKTTQKMKTQKLRLLYVVFSVFFGLSANFTFAQTSVGSCINALKFESFESALTTTTDLTVGLPRNGSYQIVQNISAAGGGGYLNVAPAAGNSFMLIHTSSTSSDRLYYANVNVVAGQTYSFCASIANSKTDPVSGFTVNLKAGNTVIATATAVYGWAQICGSYTATTTGSVQFSITDPDPTFGPSHFLSLDAICISQLSSTASIGDFVWNDLNNNGIQDSGEPGIANIQVKLFTCANVLVASTTTNSSGAYAFTNLPASSYYVQFTTPSGYVFSNKNIGTNTGKDSDADPLTGKTNCFTITMGQINTTIDAGMSVKNTIGTASIGDFVWNDINKNGIQNSGEAGIANVTVTLTLPGGSTRTTTTNSTGYYVFTALADGNYTVSFATPSGYIATASLQGSDVSKDSDPVGGSTTVTLAVGQVNNTIDAGFYLIPTPPPVAGCANAIKYESFENGSFVTSSGTDLKNGLPRNGSYEIVQNITQAGGGGYLNITPKAGNYFMLIHTSSTATDRLYYTNVNVVAGQTYSFCASIANSKTDPVSGFTVTLNAGNTVIATAAAVYGWTQLCGSYTATTTGVIQFSIKDPNPSFGPSHFLALDDICITQSVPTAKIGDFVWNDLNANGIQDAGEPGIANVSVDLYSCANVFLGTTTTNATGFYSFNNLFGGSYYVVFTAPSGFSFSAATQGADVTKDSDPNAVSGKTACFTLNAGEVNTTIDAGLYQTASIGDFVWNDTNANGVQDGGENGIANVTVKLYSCADVLVATTTTSSTGAYSFSNLTPGSYYVVFTTPSGYVIGSAGQGGDATKDSDANPLTGKTSCIILSSNENNTTIDAGLKGTGSIGDFVWHDLDADGIQGIEPGRKDVPVMLTYPNGTTVSTTTDAFGKYLFSNLAPGNYTVTFTAPEHFLISPSLQGSNPAKDSDPNASGVVNVVLGAGENNMTIDAGVYCAFLRLGNFVWHDLNNNGIQDAGEPGIAGAVVKLYKDNNGDNLPDGADTLSTITNASGYYTFTSLYPGKYIVGITIPSGYIAAATTATSATPDNDNLTDNNGVNVVAGQLFSNYITLITQKEPDTPVDGDDINGNTTLDFGFTQLGSIGDYVWYDQNVNGVQDANETGVGNVTVKLYNCADVLVATTTTNAAGAYSFNVTAGNYYVVFTAPAGYAIGAAAQGGDATKDSNADPLTGKTSCFTLVSGETNTTIDAALKGTGSIGDYVWHDLDADGIQGTEPGRKDVPLVLTYPNGSTISAITDIWGKYLFTNLAPGNYSIKFTAPLHFLFSPSLQGPNRAKDSDVDQNGVVNVTLTAGENNLTIDAGVFCAFLRLGNNVWHDENHNGLMDAGEPVIAGAIVKLYKDNNGDNLPDGADTLSTTTNASGIYSFTSLYPGKYIVGVTIPRGFVKAANTATSATPDNDVNGDNNGVRVDGGVLYSNYITLITQKEPDVAIDGDDINGNMTLDFGLECTTLVIASKSSPATKYNGFTITAVYPNPFVEQLVIGYTSETKQKVAISIFDNAGKAVYNTEVVVVAGKNKIQLSDLNKFAVGAYMLQLKTINGVYTQKLVK